MIQFFIVLFFSFKLHAEDLCHTKDLSNSKGLAERSAVGQGNSDWCYAFSYADIFSQKLGVAISPYDVAFRVNEATKKSYDRLANSDWGGGSYLDITEVLNKEPWLCTEKNYKSIEPELLADSFLRETDQFATLHSNTCKEISVFNRFFNNLNDINEIIKTAHSSSDHYDHLKKLNEKNCEQKIAFPFKLVIKDHQAGWGDQESYVKTQKYVQKVLDDGKVLSANIDVSSLFNLGLPFLEKQKQHLFGGHQATITGVEKREGRCFYKIRDAAGTLEKCKKFQKKDVVCTGDYIYEVPEQLFLKALKSTIIVAD